MQLVVRGMTVEIYTVIHTCVYSRIVCYVPTQYVYIMLLSRSSGTQ